MSLETHWSMSTQVQFGGVVGRHLQEVEIATIFTVLEPDDGGLHADAPDEFGQ